MDSSEDASEATATNSFSITKELALSSDLSISCWCPTMDLCAVVSADGQLHLHRMDWQLLWAVSPEALITAVCWRPDGKEIAAGHANGSISILDVETGDITTSHKVHYAAIQRLSWSDQAEAVTTTSSTGSTGLFTPEHCIQPHKRYKRLFVPPVLEPHPPSSTDPLPNPYEMTMEASGAVAWPPERPGLSLLCAADVRGLVSLWLQGQVQIAEVTAAVMSSNSGDDDQDEKKYKLLHALPTSQLDQLLTVSSSDAGDVVVVQRSLQLLKQQQQPLLQCTALVSQLQRFLKAAVACVEVAARDWSSALSDFRKRFDTQLKQELADQGSSITAPQQELLLLLATGCSTPPLQSFLANTLGEAGLRRLARAIDGVASGLHTALLERVMPLVELVLFLLGELRGCVACGGGQQPPSKQWMGLEVQQVQQLELHAAALLLRTEQLRRSCTDIACQYRAFFTWLLKTIRQIDGQEHSGADDISSDKGVSLPRCQEVLAFLKGQFLQDVIGPELAGSSLSPDAQARATALFYQGIQPSEVHELLALLTPSHPQTLDAICSIDSGSTQQQQQQQQQPRPELVQVAAEACSRPLAHQLQHLKSLCDECFEQPLMIISPCIAAATAQLQLLPDMPVAATAAGSSSLRKQLISVGAPLLQPKQHENLNSYVCCSVPSSVVAAAAVESADVRDEQQQQQLLIVKIPQQGLIQQQQQEEVQAVLLLLPAGQVAAAWQFYKGQQMAVLLQGGSTAVGGLSGKGHSSSSSSLHLLELSAAPWVAVQGAVQDPQSCSSRNRSSAYERCLQEGAVVPVGDVPQRSRRLHHAFGAGHLAVSRARGLASLVTDVQHLLLLDLEDDEDGDDEDACEEDGSDDGMTEA